MAVDKDFIAELLGQLAPLGAISSRPMFGGAGIFVDGKMFAKISPSNIIAFKADEQSTANFLELGMKKSGKICVGMSSVLHGHSASILTTMAHEMIHVRQFLRREPATHGKRF